MILFLVVCVYSVVSTHAYSSRVLELSDQFPEIRKGGGYWLVKFYAPWCGHCKRLEPIWAQVSQALANTEIRVAKVDCSRFPSVASEFGIRGYPTIKFITEDSDHTYHGERQKDGIVNFGIRMARPPVQEITDPQNLEGIKKMNQIFFVYVGNRTGDLWQSFLETASKLQPHVYFFSTTEEIAKHHIKAPEIPSLFVYKENISYFFTADANDNEALNSSIFSWINQERFETFPKVVRGNLQELMQTNKYIVLVILDEDKLQVSTDMVQFKDLIEGLIRKKQDKFHKSFQFGWIGSPEFANSIATQVLPVPYLLVLNSTNYDYYIPEGNFSDWTAELIEAFLDSIYNQTAPVYGGSSIAARLYRTYFDASTAVVDMWRGNPILTAVMFGLPLSFFGFIVYSICFGDILDEDEEQEEIHTKNE